MIKECALVLGVICLGGCIPYVTTYPKIDVPNATYLNPSCSGELASTAYYPFHGIYISIDIRAFRFGLHVPSGSVVELEGKTIQIEGLTGSTPYEATFALRAASHASIGTSYSPSEFYALPDRYTDANNFGPLEGAGNGNRLTWYLYRLLSPQDPKSLPRLPKGLTEGTVEIPAMIINGQRYEAQKLGFKRETSVGLAAVNC